MNLISSQIACHNSKGSAGLINIQAEGSFFVSMVPLVTNWGERGFSMSEVSSGGGIRKTNPELFVLLQEAPPASWGAEYTWGQTIPILNECRKLVYIKSVHLFQFLKIQKQFTINFYYICMLTLNYIPSNRGHSWLLQLEYFSWSGTSKVQMYSLPSEAKIGRVCVFTMILCASSHNTSPIPPPVVAVSVTWGLSDLATEAASWDA